MLILLFSFCRNPCAEIAAHKYTGSYTGSQCYTDEHIRKRSTGSNCRKCRGAYKLTNND